MFSGIVRDLGLVIKVKAVPHGRLIEIKSKYYRCLKPGESLAINGCCLTVAGKNRGNLTFQIMPETLKRTNLGESVAGIRVNLEAALRLNDLVSGHLVSGHIDAIGRIQKVSGGKKENLVTISFPVKFYKYIIPRGSITVDGVSLTVVSVTGKVFTFALIDYTLDHTTLGIKSIGAGVNLEFDLLAKYLDKIIKNVKGSK